MNRLVSKSLEGIFHASLKKKIDKVLSQPSNIGFETLDSLLREIGCTVRNTGSSQYFSKHPNLLTSLTIPKARPIKRCYGIHAIKLFTQKEKYNEISL